MTSTHTFHPVAHPAAAINLSSCSPRSSLRSLSLRQPCPHLTLQTSRATSSSSSSGSRRGRVAVTAMGGTDMTGRDVGDFGGRDPYPGEIGSNFGEKVLGNADTEHQILMPRGLTDVTGLAAKSCSPLPAGAKALEEKEARELLQKVIGWKLVYEEEGVSGSKPLSLRATWKLKDFKSAMELMRRIGEVAEAAGHHPDLHIEGFNTGRVDIWTHTIGGLSENDFILAAKIDKINVSDLIPRKRFWA